MKFTISSVSFSMPVILELQLSSSSIKLLPLCSSDKQHMAQTNTSHDLHCNLNDSFECVLQIGFLILIFAVGKGLLRVYDTHLIYGLLYIAYRG